MDVTDPNLMPDVMDISPRWAVEALSPQWIWGVQQWRQLQERRYGAGACEVSRPPFPSSGFMGWIEEQSVIKPSSENMHIDPGRQDKSLFIDPYVNYMTENQDSPPQFHPLVATVAVASCLHRDMCLFFDQSEFFPNVLGLIVSESGTRKSTAMKPLIGMANLRVLPEEVYLMPYDVTPERFVDILAEHPQALFLNDEFGHFLSRSSSRRQSYMTGFLQMMTHITDCPPRYSRSLVGREVVVEKPYLTALLGLTPEVLLSSSSLLDVLQGFLPRFLIVTGSIEDMPNRPLRPLRGITSHRTDILRQALARIYKRYQGFSYATGGCTEAPITKDALSTLNAYRERANRRIKREPPMMRPFH